MEVSSGSRRSDCAESSDEAEDSSRRAKATSALKKRDNEREERGETGKNKRFRRLHPKIGAVVRTWWPKDNAWYQGRIIAIHKLNRVIRYDDGETRSENLSRVQYEIVQG